MDTHDTAGIRRDRHVAIPTAGTRDSEVTEHRSSWSPHPELDQA